MDYYVTLEQLMSNDFGSKDIMSRFKYERDSSLILERALSIECDGIQFRYDVIIKRHSLGTPVQKVNMTFTKLRSLVKKSINQSTIFRDSIIMSFINLIFVELINYRNQMGFLYSENEIIFSKPILLIAITFDDQDYGFHANQYGDTSDFEIIGLIS